MWNTAVGRGGNEWKSRCGIALICRPQPTFTTISWSQQVPLDLLVTMVLSVHDESARIVDTHFCAETTNFASRFEPNRALFEVMISNPYSWKKFFPMVYNMSMFGVICKKSYVFQD